MLENNTAAEEALPSSDDLHTDLNRRVRELEAISIGSTTEKVDAAKMETIAYHEFVEALRLVASMPPKALNDFAARLTPTQADLLRRIADAIPTRQEQPQEQPEEPQE